MGRAELLPPPYQRCLNLYVPYLFKSILFCRKPNEFNVVLSFYLANIGTMWKPPSMLHPWVISSTPLL